MAPRQPSVMVGRSGFTRGPSEAMSTSAAKSALCGGDQLGQALGAGFLAHLDDELGIEAEPAAALGPHGVERRHVEGVLALVVGGAAAVEAVAVAGRDPRAFALGPLVLQAADDVAVAVAEHRRQRGILDVGREQHRPLVRQRVVVDARGEAEASKAGVISSSR